MECDSEGKSILSLLKKASQESVQWSADASLDVARCQGRFPVSAGGVAHLGMVLAYDNNKKQLYEYSASCMMQVCLVSATQAVSCVV